MATKKTAAATAEKKPANAKKTVAEKKTANAVKATPIQKAAPVQKPAEEKKAAPVQKPIIEKKTPAGNKKVLFVCSEAFPFAGTGGLGEVMGSLPQAINAKKSGFEARIILPLYESFPAEYRAKLEFICHINVPLAWRNQYCGLFKLYYKGRVYYFIENEYYFKRPYL